MNRTRPAQISTLLSLLAAVALIAALPLLAQPAGAGPGAAAPAAGANPAAGAGDGTSDARHALGLPLRALARFLALSEQQVADTRVLLEELAATLRPLGEEAHALRQELRAALDSDAPDATAVGTLVIALEGIADEARAARQATDAAFTALLDPEQAERWEILKEARRAFGR